MLQRSIPPGKWDTRRQEKNRRIDRLGIAGKVLPRDDLPAMLEKLIAPGDRVVLEGNNQKQADFLARMLAQANPEQYSNTAAELAAQTRTDTGTAQIRGGRNGKRRKQV